MVGQESRVLIENKGYIPIGDVLEKDFSVWNGEEFVDTSVTFSPSEPLLLVRLLNGVELVCSKTQDFMVKYKKFKAIEAAANLNKDYTAWLTDSVPEFDYLDLSCYKYLSELNSQQLGTLVGLFYTLGADLDLPQARKETVKEIFTLLTITGVPFSMDVYFKRTDRIKFSINSDEFFQELESFKIGNSIPRKFWQSKLIWKGFLKALFTFCIVGTEMFTIRANKDSMILKDIQQGLLLFGINSTYTKGFKVSQLMVFSTNCYRLANNIGIFNPENLLTGVDYKRFLGYVDRTTKEMKYVKVLDTSPLKDGVAYGIVCPKVSANGVIIKNYE